jgi:hypothetical protein
MACAQGPSEPCWNPFPLAETGFIPALTEDPGASSGSLSQTHPVRIKARQKNVADTRIESIENP